jgi:V/A-type H+-transporting ATPase subunit C
MPVDVPLMSDFTEQAEYAYAVARIRALETTLIDSTAITSLMTTPSDRFMQAFQEVSQTAGGTHDTKDHDPTALLRLLEDRLTDTFLLARSLIIEDAMRRLLSLEYDYRLLNLIVKKHAGGPSPDGAGGPPAGEHRPGEHHFREICDARANYSFQSLQAALQGGRVTETGETLYGTYRSLTEKAELSGGVIDLACTRGLYTELFGILEGHPNGFIRGFYVRRVDGFNVIAMLRQKLRGGKRSDLAERFLPFGSIGLEHIEEGLDMTIDGFAARIVFSPIGPVLRGVDKSADGEEQIAQAERLIDDAQIGYLRESLFVTFGLEPIFAYLRMKEMELLNLRTVLICRLAEVPVEEIRGQMRGYHG